MTTRIYFCRKTGEVLVCDRDHIDQLDGVFESGKRNRDDFESISNQGIIRIRPLAAGHMDVTTIPNPNVI